MDDTQLILEAQGITKAFKGIKALDGVDLDIATGEVHALLGENGAGKTTLIKILAGAYRYDRGTIRFNGGTCRFASPLDAYRAGITVIYQEMSLIPQLTVLENVFLGIEACTAFFKIIKQKELLNRFYEVCDTLNYRFDPHQRVATLTVAQQKMVEIIKAIVRDSSFFIMDEPTDALSDREITTLFSLIHRLKKQGVTIVYITHDLDEVFTIADRLTILRDGKKVVTIPVSKTTKTSVIKMMTGREQRSPALAGSKKVYERALCVESLSKKGVVHNITFTAHKGEILGITGLTGAGKTELARLLFGVDPYDTGSVMINGKKVLFNAPHTAVKHKMGMVPEDRKNHGLLLEHPVYKNISLAALKTHSRNGILSKTGELFRARELVDRLNIKISGLHQPVMNLSGGNQQKVVIAKWLAVEPDVLILDEPTRGIDIGAKHEVYAIIKALAAAGTCILFFSSEISEIVTIAERILVMHKGRILCEKQQGITRHEILAEIHNNKEGNYLWQDYKN